MQKQAPTLGRVLTMVGFALSCFGLLLFLWLAFGGPVPLQPKGYRFNTSFAEATQLAKEADVRISGVSVGKVKSIDPDKKNGRARAVIEIDPQYAPIAKDTKAVLRQKTLLGETYVELTPGDGKKAGWVKENGTLPDASISPTVELDEIFRAFDPKTRVAFQNWMQQLAIGSNGRARDINDTLGNLAPFAQDANTLVEILNSQSGAVRKLVSNTGEVFNALSERQGQLSSLITNSNAVFATTARRNKDLQDLFIVLPTFEKESKQTIERLTKFSKNTNPLITQLRPAARQISPTLVSLSSLAPDLQALFRDLDPLIKVSVRGLPATEKFLKQLRPVLGELDPTLRQLNPILSYLGTYRDEINSFFANTVATTQPTAAVGNTSVHYLRTTNPVNLENLAVYGSRLASNRPNPYAKSGMFRQLKDGLQVYEDRQCKSGPVPTLAPVNAIAGLLGGAAIANQLVSSITGIGGGVGLAAPAPPCKKQGPFTVNGKTSQNPQVTASSGAVARGVRTASK
jgi:phospholipid/cholesterol/gamma-HCH transport system substrate-binding protein